MAGARCPSPAQGGRLLGAGSGRSTPRPSNGLRTLWEAWEAARAEGGNAMSYWWRVHVDAHWAALTDSATGPFSACARRGQHSTDLGALPGDFDGTDE